jgi:hypothetical protein
MGGQKYKFLKKIIFITKSLHKKIFLKFQQILINSNQIPKNSNKIPIKFQHNKFQ